MHIPAYAAINRRSERSLLGWRTEESLAIARWFCVGSDPHNIWLCLGHYVHQRSPHRDRTEGRPSLRKGERTVGAERVIMGGNGFAFVWTDRRMSTRRLQNALRSPAISRPPTLNRPGDIRGSMFTGCVEEHCHTRSLYSRHFLDDLPFRSGQTCRAPMALQLSSCRAHLQRP